MKKKIMLSLSFVFAFAIVGLAESASAADQVQDAYAAYNQNAGAIEQQLYAKQAELDALYANPEPDTARAQQLFREIGELKGQLFAAEAELRSQAGDPGVAYSGMHHNGEFSRGGYEYRGHRGAMYGHRGNYNRHGGGHHGGW